METINDGGNIDKLEKNRIIYVFEWQNEGFWCRNYIWIQGYPPEEKNHQGRVFLWKGKMIGQLQLLFIVRDESQKNARRYHLYYTGAVVELFQ